jgi:hypothetical protein
VTGEPATCDFFDRRGVLLEERGQPLPDDHLANCPHCRQRQRQLATLREDLRRLPGPPSRPGWEAGVWAGIARRDQGQGATRAVRWILGLGLPAAAAMAALLLWLRPPGGDPAGTPAVSDRPLLAMRIVPGAQKHRAAGQAAAGDELRVVVHSATGNAEVRVYRDDVGLAVRCSDKPPCSRKGKSLELRWPLPAVGRYRVQVVGAPSALPEPEGSYDIDTARLMAVPEHWKLEELLEVW